ncbi:MAG: 4'-phosphopantetheinyl transferase superfamily protein, partial [Oscillospiraceae bacterium]|nr:4'-phosphopantetheinyl transferase superfamily protein [Oscillospiraceae bacterium]
DLVSAARGEAPGEVALTPGERALCASRPFPAASRAARLAGKSAVRKALRLGEEIPPEEIEIPEDAFGAPEVKLHGTAAAAAAERGVRRVELTLSEEEGFALAFAVAIL